jgi:hypothetical protein
MSIKEMILDHPAVGDDYNEQLGEAVRHAMYGAAIFNSCADACLAEPIDMNQCIRRCLDASDACTAFFRIASRRTGHNVAAIKASGAAAIIACEECLEECDKHDNAHCRRCARMCREVIEDVTKAVQGLGKGG